MHEGHEIDNVYHSIKESEEEIEKDLVKQIQEDLGYLFDSKEEMLEELGSTLESIYEYSSYERFTKTIEL